MASKMGAHICDHAHQSAGVVEEAPAAPPRVVVVATPTGTAVTTPAAEGRLPEKPSSEAETASGPPESTEKAAGPAKEDKSPGCTKEEKLNEAMSKHVAQFQLKRKGPEKTEDGTAKPPGPGGSEPGTAAAGAMGATVTVAEKQFQAEMSLQREHANGMQVGNGHTPNGEKPPAATAQ